LGGFLWRVGDRNIIDGFMVNGSARSVGWFSEKLRYVQSGLLSQYAFAMLLGLLFFLVWFVHG
jgi:NADH-quinone oxidoreductase subunit L